jgi:CRISPR-associated protein Csm3
MAQFVGNILLRGKIECLTGLHIGGSKDKMEIGGVDSPVLRDPATRQPYIPGSSLKGKMRSLLEFVEGKVGDGNVHSCKLSDCPVCRVFGSSASEDRQCGPTRLLVRDAYADKTTQQMWENLDSELLYTELKSENGLNRITSAANPRFLERVVKGSKFDLELVYGVYDVDSHDDLKFFAHVRTALLLLEQSALGGSGSRGYGRIKFMFAPPVMVGRDAYRNGLDAVKKASVWPEDKAFDLSTDALAIDTAVVNQWRSTT